jgi:hypothetical protein
VDSVVPQPNGGLLLVVDFTERDGCDFPLIVTQELRSGEPVLVIDVARDTAALSNVPCQSTPVSKALDILVDAALLEPVLADTRFEYLYLVVNNTYLRTKMEAAGGTTRAFTTTETLYREDAGFRPQDLTIERATAEDLSLMGGVQGAGGDTPASGFVLVANGMYATTCLGPDVVRTQFDGGTIKVEIFKLIAEDTRSIQNCPQTFALPMFRGRIPLQVPGEDGMMRAPVGVFVLNVNGTQFSYDFDTGTRGEVSAETPGELPAATVIDTVIERAQILVMESFPVQLSLQVVGYQPDGCDFPVIVEQTQDGNAINVHIYREIPANVRCTMMIVPYEAAINLGSFTAGTYTVNVNGTVIEVQV